MIPRNHKVGDLVYLDRKPENFAKVVKLLPKHRVDYEFDGEKKHYEQDHVVIKRYNGKEKTVPAHFARRFDDLIEEQMALVKKWRGLRAQAKKL